MPPWAPVPPVRGSPSASIPLAHSPFIIKLRSLGVALLDSQSALPLSSQWLLFVVPATYLVANAAWSQPRARFLKVALLNFYFLLQVAVYAFWSVVLRDKRTRAHFFTVRDLGAERELCNRILSLLLPPTIMASMARAPAAAAAAAASYEQGILSEGEEQLAAPDMGSVAAANERFAERFPDASVMFAMGEERGGAGGSLLLLSPWMSQFVWLLVAGNLGRMLHKWPFPPLRGDAFAMRS